MELGAGVCPAINAFRCNIDKVFNSLGRNFTKQSKCYAAQRFVIVFYVKVHLIRDFILYSLNKNISRSLFRV